MTNQRAAICSKAVPRLKAAGFLQMLQCNRVGTETQHFMVERVKEAFKKRHQRERGHIENRAENVWSLREIQQTKQSSTQ